MMGTASIINKRRGVGTIRPTVSVILTSSTIASNSPSTLDNVHNGQFMSPPAQSVTTVHSPSPSDSTPIAQNIDAVAALKLRSEKNVGKTQRLVEQVTARLGRPQFFVAIVVGSLVWMFANALAPRLGLRQLDAPPFPWMQGFVGLAALLMTSMILITQNRQGEISSRLEHLDLQMSMLTEQKAAKIIELLEEMRRDSPTLRNRVDPEAEALQEAADPDLVLTALEFKLTQVLDSATEMELAAVKTENAVEEAIEEVVTLRQEFKHDQ